jgi:hypothetical protein
MVNKITLGKIPEHTLMILKYLKVNYHELYETIMLLVNGQEHDIIQKQDTIKRLISRKR